MPKISQLTALTTPDSGDELPIVDVSASTTKKITRTNLLKGAPLPADTVDTQAIADDAVTAPKTDFGGNYSTSEVNTGFKWTDGKDIYKKTINWTIASGSGTKNQAHGISNIENVIKMEGTTINGSTWQPLSFNVNVNFWRYMFANATNVGVEQGSAFTSNNDVRMTIYYTKT